jgi:hypothetical protein
LSPDSKFDELQVYISSLDKKKVLTYASLEGLPDPVLTVDDKVLPLLFYLEDEFRQDLDEDGYASEVDPDDPSKRVNCVLLSAWVPSQWNPTSAQFKLVFPFCGNEYQQVFGVSEAEPVFSISRWADAKLHHFLITVRGAEFENLARWSVELDRVYTLEPADQPLVRLSSVELSLNVPANSLEGSERIIVRYNDPDTKEVSVYPVQIPPVAAPPKPSVIKNLVEVPAQTGAVVNLEGMLLGIVAKIRLIRNGGPVGTAMDFIVSPEGTKVTILFSAQQMPGFGELVLEDGMQMEIGRVPVLVKS